MINIDVDTTVTIPVNAIPLTDNTDFITRETGITYDQAGMDLTWHFIPSSGDVNTTAVTPTTTGDYNWTHIGDGMYKIAMPSTGGASINNDTEGVGYFVGFCSGVLPWRSSNIIFRSAEINDMLVDSSTTITALNDQYDGVTGLTGDTYPATQSQVGTISVGAGGLAVPSETFVLTSGTESAGTYVTTEQLNNAHHTILPSGSVINGYYQFDVGVNGVGTDILWDGYVGNNGDNIEIYGYDWVSSSYKQIKTLVGKNANTNEEQSFRLTKSMTGTGADVGKVRVKFLSDGVDVAVDLNTDRIWCEYTSVAAERSQLHNGIAQSGTTNTITLDSGANSTDDFYKHGNIVISEGTATEQERIIVNYNGSTKVATIAPPWIEVPDTTSVFEILPGNVHAETNSKTVKVGLAQSGSLSTITLSSDASSVNDYYKDDIVEIDFGTGEGQARVITAYNGTTKLASVTPDWITAPDSTSEYIVEEALTVTGKIETSVITADALATDAAEEIADTVWDEATSGHNVGGSFGKALRQTKEATVSIESTVNDGSPSATGFVTALTEATNNHYQDVSVVFIDGNLAGQSKAILSYNGSTKAFNFDEGFTEAPASGDSFIVKTDHVHSVSQITSDVLTTQMTESYAADGTAPTVAQALFLIQQSLGDFSISNGTLTVKKLDGSTTAAEFTLSPSGNPTSTTRAS